MPATGATILGRLRPKPSAMRAGGSLALNSASDLRSLPYSFLVLTRDPPPPGPTGLSRLIGEPREGRGHYKVLSCQSAGVAEFMLQKRDAPEL